MNLNMLEKKKKKKSVIGRGCKLTLFEIGL
jgi:hypothetical protein